MRTAPRKASSPATLPAKVGVIGDVHAEDALLEAALGRLVAAGAEAILCTGDLPDGTGSVERCSKLLREHDAWIVRGNHERWLLEGSMRDLPDATALATVPVETREHLARLPSTLPFVTSLGGLLLCHGLGTNDMAKVGPDDHGYALEANDELQELMRDPRYAFVVNGHSHRSMVRHFPGLTVINAGTLKADHTPGCLLIDFHAEEVSFFVWEGRFELRRIDALRLA